MKKAKENFSVQFDELFEKPKLKAYNSAKMRILLAVGVIAVAFAAAAPSVFHYLSVKKTADTVKDAQTVMESVQKNLDEFDESLPYTEVMILRSKVYLDQKPNYRNPKAYQLKIDDSGIDFGNGYVLHAQSSKGLYPGYPDPSLEVKPTPDDEYVGVDVLAQYVFAENAYVDLPSAVYISGNLISNLEIQVDKSKGSWAEVLKKEDDPTGVKTGYMLNYHAAHAAASSDDITASDKNFLQIYRYWIFPDGVGIYLMESGFPKKDLLKSEMQKLSSSDQLNLANEAADGAYSGLATNFELVKSK
ncbi:MAG: hypothetical protein LBV19_02985 [Streptococcaceae bacterium]|jgi:hypothetical protein|nr:hypothetical protein [Streptococcaceae bacterium]